MTAMSSYEVRNVKFDVSALPRYWHGQRKAVTAFFNNLSIFFPAGERFFIASVRAYRDAIKDPQLLEDMRTFYGQEGVHTREHIRYNEALSAQGYPVEAMDARVQTLLGLVSRIPLPRGHLAVTCALEHFTALIADWLLSNPELFEGVDPNMAALWRWHAAEENEHKAVAFDVFKSVGGTYAERAIIMVLATIIFWAKVAEHQVRLMRADGTLFSASEWGAMLRFLVLRKGGFLSMVPAYFDYFRPSFHPWDHDNRHLLSAWKEDFARDELYRASAARAAERPRPAAA
jgi:predicted metal-dependent hydrolase